MELYTYYRSSAAYRVRIALNLKGLDYQSIPVHLVRNGGEQKAPEYLAKNPQGLVPTLVENDQSITQSIAIIEYLNEAYPEPNLLPGTAQQRAQTRALALSIACDIHPINNLRVLQYLSTELEATDEQKNTWYRHWVEQGFAALEKTLSDTSHDGQYCVGGQPTLADCCLIPQVYNALRFKVDMTMFPTIQRINEHCLSLDAFDLAVPENQPDASA